MKKAKNLLIAALATLALIFGMAGCSEPEDENQNNSSTEAPQLPGSTGTNELRGKTFVTDYELNESDNSISYSLYEFTDSTITISHFFHGETRSEQVCNYTYDAEKKLIYSLFDGDKTPEYLAMVQEMGYKDCNDILNARIQEYIDKGMDKEDAERRGRNGSYLLNVDIIHYEISGKTQKIGDKSYPVLNRASVFDKSDSSTFSVRFSVSEMESSLFYSILGFDGNDFQYKYEAAPIWDKNSFSGNLYEHSSTECKKLGTIRGSYEVTGNLTDGYEFTLTVTESPLETLKGSVSTKMSETCEISDVKDYKFE